MGLVDRDDPETLVLERLGTSITKPHAPGPGAIKRLQWDRLGTKWIKGRKILLHTDSARSYKAKIEGVIHDNVVHQKKRIYNKKLKKYIWMNPKFTKTVKHKLPNGKVLNVKAGTQIIDRCWAFLKNKFKYRLQGRVGSLKVARRIRSAQWFYWNRLRSDLWAETGKMLQFIFKDTN
jgi:hypothetical protein